jgi:hypothetical protein
MTKSVYFVTYRIYKNSKESLKNAVCGDVEESHDYWIKTNHYDSEDKMIKFVFDRLVMKQELVGELYHNLQEEIHYGTQDDYVVTLAKAAIKIKKQLDELFTESCKLKSSTIENKKKVISIIEKYFTKPVVGISYGVVSVK